MTIYWTRTDSNSANNPALNSTGAASIQIEFVTSGTNGDLILEQPAPGTVDPDTQVMINGAAYDFVFELSGTMPTTNNNGANQVPDQYKGSDVYVITVYDYPSAGDTTRLYFFPNETATQAEMDSIGNGAIDIQNLDMTPPEGPVCFAAGTAILTPDGEVPIERLKVGDLVTTIDGATLPILWIESTRHDWPGSSDKALPVMIARDAFGPSLPRRDLVVSPQHKIALTEQTGSAKEAPQECLAPARGLVDRAGIRVMRGRRSVEYFHMLLPRHAVIFSEGLATESFYPGETAWKMLSFRAARALGRALRSPDGKARDYGPPARPVLTVRQARETAGHMAALLASAPQDPGMTLATA